MRKKAYLIFCLAAFWILPASVSAGDVFPFEGLDTLYRRLSKVYNPGVEAHWLGDSQYFWYRNYTRDGYVFCLVDAMTGQKNTADSRENLAGFLSGQPELAALLTEDGKAEPAAVQEAGTQEDTVLSPDGKWKAYIRDDNVFVVSLSETEAEPVQLSLDGAPGFGYCQLNWSPDSRKLAAMKVREVKERQIPLLESAPESQLQPILHWINYAKPGDVLPVTLPALFDIEGMRQVPMDTEEYENQFWLYFTGWRKDSRGYTFEFNQRGHQRYIIGEVNAADGSITKVVDEKAKTFIDYTRNYRHDTSDGKEIIWLSERDGWKHLYLIDAATGAVKCCMTQGDWVVRQVVNVDEQNRQVLFMASGMKKKEDPYNMHLCRVNFDGTGFTDLTPENANHVISFSADRSRFVDVYSRPDMPAVSVLRDGHDGEIIAELEKCDISELQATGWVMPEVFHAKGRDGKTDIWGTIFRPSNFDPEKSYPVIEDIYAGPHDSFVNKNFSAFEYFITPLVELGFIVVKIDGMGTNNRSKAFHDVCWKNLKDSGYPDRILWIKAAAGKYPYMDTDRVGVYGWSAGGQSAMGALLFFNDFYKAAVSFCGCHDNRMDKIWWNEQWMGYPVDESYSRSSNVDNAHLLKGDLLLINGELDNNVDPASTLQVVNALMKAGKMFEQLYLPGRDHNLGQQFEVYRMYDFFVRKLRDRNK